MSLWSQSLVLSCLPQHVVCVGTNVPSVKLGLLWGVVTLLLACGYCVCIVFLLCSSLAGEIVRSDFTKIKSVYVHLSVNQTPVLNS